MSDVEDGTSRVFRDLQLVEAPGQLSLLALTGCLLLFPYLGDILGDFDGLWLFCFLYY